MKAKHTPGPWSIQGANDDYSLFSIEAENWGRILKVEDISNEIGANAEFIVRACNNYEELLEAAKQFVDGPDDVKAFGRLADAISNTEGNHDESTSSTS